MSSASENACSKSSTTSSPNACRFIGKGGHVTIKLEGLAEQSIVSVLDDGPGFGNVDPKLLFTRFYRGDNSRARNTGGTGLGLAIAKSIVDAHDGTIEAFNRAEGGCMLYRRPSQHSRACDVARPHHSTESSRILFFLRWIAAPLFL